MLCGYDDALLFCFSVCESLLNANVIWQVEMMELVLFGGCLGNLHPGGSWKLGNFDLICLGRVGCEEC